MSKKKIQIVLNLVIFGLMILGWCIMAFRYTGDSLTAAGIASMKFFTVLSNVFRGIVSLVMAVFLLRTAKTPMIEGNGQNRLSGRSESASNAPLQYLHFMSTCSVGLTFLVVFAFFGPLYGIARMLKGANFFFHLIIPLLSMLEYVLFAEKKMKMPGLLTAAIPPLIYGICYLINLLVNGIGYGPDSNDWYGFAIWGLPAGMGIFAAICVASVLIGTVLNALGSLIQKKW